MGIVYIVSALVLYISFILIKKTEKELNILSFMGISIVLLMCYNTFVCYVFTFFRIPITLVSLSIINAIFSILIIYFIIKRKSKQKYKLDKFGLICSLIIIALALLVAYLNFGFPFNIKYETGDPSVHFVTSRLFTDGDSLLNLTKDKIYGSFQTRKIASYVNSGIIMKSLSTYVDKMDNYKIFISLDIFVFTMTGLMMYNTLEKFTNSKKGKILALIVSIIYMMGYPLNSLYYGFEYQSLGILIITTLIHMIYYFEKEELKFGYYLVIFALLNFTLFCAYYMYIPFMYSGLWIYFCIYSKKQNGKILCKRNISLLSITLLLPFFLGYIYHLSPGIYSMLNSSALEAFKAALNHANHMINNVFKLNGKIYVNYYSNFILLIPLIGYYIYKKIKKKELFSFENITLACTLIFMLVLVLGVKFEKVSVYYYMKNYYALWIIVIYINFRALMYIFEKHERRAYSILMTYVLIILINLVIFRIPLENKTFNRYESILSPVEIFGINKTIIVDRKEDLSTEEIDLLKYAKEHLNFDNDKIEFVASSEELQWIYGLTGYINFEEEINNSKFSGEDKLLYKKLKIEKIIDKEIKTDNIDIDYIIYLKNDNQNITNTNMEKDTNIDTNTVINKNTDTNTDADSDRNTDTMYENNITDEKINNMGEIIYENDVGKIIKYR